ncbi:non-heme iron oxygenase ferredoxin subunit [Frankia sp. AgB1.9]|uniref:non-heme iron oxygenase ferredoxin subunit n=1 Tax=unclassified Frankia TaxID=2632575 RepID=UPI00193219FF|nr:MULTISPECIES: non-heme iron oxygenase ferredoxin subunit [unclassified Frankia]MBL7492316.1 non-heme iron oxygenase ferredoxin subunit [Frankia sp. AgW1.1]MBL7551865.1 non-heme iron oxygenase ferredoxin subunit [Frankia sp. AgB1.9]MBL7625554.1 non-heme iron oxygenase ferredoxin subunit [Frankia sp. AgB1.8]
MSLTYVRVCALADVPEDGALALDVAGTSVAIVRSQGEVHAIEDRCTHADVPLSDGEVYKGAVECWLHGSSFDLRTGKATCLPATTPIAVFRAQVVDGEVLVSLVREN